MPKIRWIVFRLNFGDAGPPDMFIVDSEGDNAWEHEQDLYTYIADNLERNASTCFPVPYTPLLKFLSDRWYT